jgi:hypothetical protein
MLIRTAPRRVQRTAARQHGSAGPRIVRTAAPPRPDGHCACGGGCPRCLSAALRTPSRPIDAADRGFVERRLGHDFGTVRLHHDDTAAATSSALGARAWTFGEHVAFGRGEYRPGHDGYRRLLAHELAHVLQQADAGQPTSMSLAPPGDAFEREAESMAAAAMSPDEPSGPPVPVSASPAAVQRALKTDAPVSVQENLAERIVTGGRTAGFVLFKLNGKVLNMADDPQQRIDPAQPDKIKANARGAIKRPGVTTKSIEVNVNGKKETHLAGEIVQVPLNTFATEVHTLTPPPWKTTTTRADVFNAFPDARWERQCKGSSDPCQFEVMGLPDPHTLAAATLAHENQHAADFANVFETVFRPWDTQVQLAKDTSKLFSAATANQATTDLWAFLGGSPEAIADALADEVDASGKRMHAGMAEPNMDPKNPIAAADCSTATLDVEGGK